MLVETHAFKSAFVRGETSGFVVCTERPVTPGHPARRVFAEIYGAPNRYHIFETRPAAEFQMALAATGDPPLDGLSVHEVRVENIRDYQTLSGFKTVFLVDRDRRAAESLRVGDLPLSVRTLSPFSLPNRDGLRLATSTPTAKPFPPPSTNLAPPAALPPVDNPPPPPAVIPSPPAVSSQPRTMPRLPFASPTTDPFADVPVDEGDNRRLTRRRKNSDRPGFFVRCLRAIFWR